MNMLDIHADAVGRPITAYHDFLQSYSTKSKMVYGFVEGNEDPMFYRGIIENLLPSDWNVKLIPAGNRNKVLANYTDLDWTRFPLQRICFFIDRDLSNFTGDELPTYENLYITEKYAIENEAISASTFERVLQEVLNVTGASHKETETILQLFHNNWEFFIDAMVPIMVQIIQWRRNGERPCLDDIDTKNLFLFKNGRITLKPEFISYESRVEYAGKCCNLLISNRDNLACIEKEYREQNGPQIFTRGKYVLWFFVECALKIYESIATYCSKYKAPPKVHTNFGTKNALISVGPRARVPMSLREFLTKTYLEYIINVEQKACYS